MIVKIKNDKIDTSGIILGKNYKIISLSIVDNSKSMFRIISEDGTPALYDVNLFEIIDNKIDDGYFAYLRAGGLWEICPSEISSEDFWIKFFNGDPNSEKCYHKVISCYSIY